MNELIIKMQQLFDAFDFDHYVITKQYKKIFKENIIKNNLKGYWYGTSCKRRNYNHSGL